MSHTHAHSHTHTSVATALLSRDIYYDDDPYRVEYYIFLLGEVTRWWLITNAKLAHSYSKFYNTAVYRQPICMRRLSHRAQRKSGKSSCIYMYKYGQARVGEDYRGNNYFIYNHVGMLRVCVRARVCICSRRRGLGGEGLELCHTYSVLTANLFTRDRRPSRIRIDLISRSRVL